MELDYDSLYVGGEWITPASSSKITVVSASTEQVIGHVPEAVQADNHPRPLRGHPRQAPARLTWLAWRAHDLSRRSLQRARGAPIRHPNPR